MLVGLALADLASSLPTSGGLYWWTHHFAPPAWKRPLSFVVGYSNTLGLIGGTCSVDYGFATMLLALISIARDGTWTASRPLLYGTYAATVVVHGCVATFAAPIMHYIQSASIFSNTGLVLASAIALPVGLATLRGHGGVADRPLNSGAYVFGTTENLTTWPGGWTFVLGWLSPIWTINSLDSCVHMSEEAANAVRAVPIGIVGSAFACGLLGFLTMATIAAVVNPDIDAVMNTPYGQPMAQIYHDSLGKSGALGFMSVITVVQFFMGLSLVIAASRQSWAFSRDGATPFSSFFRVVTACQPIRAVWGCCLVAIVVGLLCLIDDAAATALFSVGVAGNALAWLVPILTRVVSGRHLFRPGRWYSGRLSEPIALAASAYLVFSIVLVMFPSGGPNPSREFWLPLILLLLADCCSRPDELCSCPVQRCMGRIITILLGMGASVVRGTQDDGRVENRSQEVDVGFTLLKKKELCTFRGQGIYADVNRKTFHWVTHCSPWTLTHMLPTVAFLSTSFFV